MGGEAVLGVADAPDAVVRPFEVAAVRRAAAEVDREPGVALVDEVLGDAVPLVAAVRRRAAVRVDDRRHRVSADALPAGGRASRRPRYRRASGSSTCSGTTCGAAANGRWGRSEQLRDVAAGRPDTGGAPWCAIRAPRRPTRRRARPVTTSVPPAASTSTAPVAASMSTGRRPHGGCVRRVRGSPSGDQRSSAKSAPSAGQLPRRLPSRRRRRRTPRTSRATRRRRPAGGRRATTPGHRTLRPGVSTPADVAAGGDVGDVQARAVEVVAVQQRRGTRASRPVTASPRPDRRSRRRAASATVVGRRSRRARSSRSGPGHGRRR